MKLDDVFSKMKSIPLYVQAKKNIIDMIQSGVFKDNKLPSESSLSETLGISRTTIREALIALNRDGVITKKQGVGNLFHLSTLNTRMRIDQIKDFVELLEDGGYSVTVKRLGLTWVGDVKGFDIEPLNAHEKRYIKSEVVYLADNQAAILTTVIIPESVLKNPNFDLDMEGEKLPAKSLSDFLNAQGHEEVSHSISVFHPTRVGEINARLLNLNAGDPIIEWRERYFGINDNPLSFTRIIFHPELVSFAMLRKWD